MFDPVDKILPKLKPKELLESPNFLLTKMDYEKYRKNQINLFLMPFICLVKK